MEFLKRWRKKSQDMPKFLVEAERQNGRGDEKKHNPNGNEVGRLSEAYQKTEEELKKDWGKRRRKKSKIV